MICFEHLIWVNYFKHDAYFQNFSCTEYWDPSLTVVQDFITDCSHVFEVRYKVLNNDEDDDELMMNCDQAQYCVKMTGIFEGKLGTKRFCSSRDWGYYCEYIKRPGDIQVNLHLIQVVSINVVHSLPVLLTIWIEFIIKLQRKLKFIGILYIIFICILCLFVCLWFSQFASNRSQ